MKSKCVSVSPSVCLRVCLSICMLRMGEQLDEFAQFFLEVVGKFREVSAKYQIIISMYLT